MSDPERIDAPTPRRPVDLPLGWTNMQESTQVTGPSGGSAATNTQTPMSSLVGHGRVGKRRLSVIESGLSERDRELLRAIEQHRYLSSRHVQAICFYDHATPESAARTTRRVLARLHRDQLTVPLQRRIGGVRAGSSSTVWQLAPAGARLLSSDGSLRRTHEPSLRFLQHCLAIADVRIELEIMARQAAVESIDIALEPDCWRQYSGAGGERRWLQPDLAARIVTRDYVDRWFIEVDLGTESLPTVLRKCSVYETYRATGQEQSSSGVFPLVLWIFTSAERSQKVQRAIGRSHTLTPELYRTALIGQVEAAVLGGEQ